jgi:ATP-binding cassette subfamily B protein
MILQTNTNVDLYTRAFDKTIRHAHSFFVSNFAGSLTSRVNKYARALDTLFDALILTFLGDFVFIIGAIYVLLTRNVLLGVSVLVWSSAFLCFQLFVSRVRHPVRIEVSKADTQLIGTLSDAITNHMNVSLFSNFLLENKRLSNVLENWKFRVTNIWSMDQKIWIGIGLFNILLQVFLIYSAIILWGENLLTVGDFALIQSYILIIFGKFAGINRTFRRFYDALADAGEMVAILETPHEIQDVSGAKDLLVGSGNIVFDDVGFAFDVERPILNHLSLNIQSGQKVALVGPSGAGKSTITKLLLRLYDVHSGTITIDGQNIAQVTQDSLRNAIGFVPQEPLLFHRSLMENIRYGRRDAIDAQVVDAARQAHCHEFISQLPQQYDTLVGERGVKLSGGERQRVAIARAILKNAPILILDEATSSLDSESESYIQDSLRTLMQGKTVLVIAHRLSTISHMDRILVIQHGAVEADGTHTELLERDGLYQKLWSIQAGGFIPDEE